MASKIGQVYAVKKEGSNYSYSGHIYLLGIKVSIGLKKDDKGLIIESFGLPQETEEDKAYKEKLKSEKK